MSSEIFSKVSVKSQTVIPKAVRQHLHIKEGDELEYQLLDGGVLVRLRTDLKPSSEDPFSTFNEWSSREDEEAYNDL